MSKSKLDRKWGVGVFRLAADVPSPNLRSSRFCG